MAETDLGPLLVIALAGGLIAGAIASGRGHSFAAFFVIGFLLPVVGIVVALLASPNRLGQITPASSAGWWPDPTGRFDGRYYDGRSWTRHVARKTTDGEPRQYEDPI